MIVNDPRLPMPIPEGFADEIYRRFNMIKLENIQAIDTRTKYTLQPHLHGDWKVIRTWYVGIDCTCKDSHIIPEIHYEEYSKVVFIGTLTEM